MAVVVVVCVRFRGSMTVMTSTLVTATTLVSGVPVREVAVLVTVWVLVVEESGDIEVL